MSDVTEYRSANRRRAARRMKIPEIRDFLQHATGRLHKCKCLRQEDTPLPPFGDPKAKRCIEVERRRNLPAGELRQVSEYDPSNLCPTCRAYWYSGQANELLRTVLNGEA